jgi:hypothetical protein
MSKVVPLSDIGGIKTSNKTVLGQDAGTGTWLEHIWDEAFGFALVFCVFWKFGC